MAIKLTVSSILDDLNNGLTRDDIRTKYKMSPKDIKELFKHPKLKNKKTKTVYVPGFELEDDTENVTTDAEQVKENVETDAEQNVQDNVESTDSQDNVENDNIGEAMIGDEQQISNDKNNLFS